MQSNKKKDALWIARRARWDDELSLTLHPKKRYEAHKEAAQAIKDIKSGKLKPGEDYTANARRLNKGVAGAIGGAAGLAGAGFGAVATLIAKDVGLKALKKVPAAVAAPAMAAIGGATLGSLMYLKSRQFVSSRNNSTLSFKDGRKISTRRTTNLLNPFNNTEYRMTTADGKQYNRKRIVVNRFGIY